MASKALYLLCIISLLLVIPGSITTVQARTFPADAVPPLLDIVDEGLMVIRSYIGSPQGPSPDVPARDANGPLPKPPSAANQLLPVE